MYIDPKFIKKVPANVEGRDFVVGDLHGCFEELLKLLKYVSFDVEKDRLFSTGDLIDRGPRSLDCISLLSKSWFYPVLGNHEDLFLSKLKMLENKRGQNFKDDEIDFLKKAKRYENKIYEMPLVYEIDHVLFNKIYIVHAEILPEHILSNDQAVINMDDEKKEKLYERFSNYMKKNDFSTQIKSFLNIDKYPNNQIDYSLKQKLIWSRKIISKFYNDNKDAIDAGDFSFLKENGFSQDLKVFCGHNIVPFPMKIGQQYYIDTGAALGFSSKEINSDLFSQFGHEFFALSMVDLTTGICYGCITSKEQRGQIMKLEDSIYEYA